jgi:hypothetical protein
VRREIVVFAARRRPLAATMSAKKGALRKTTAGKSAGPMPGGEVDRAYYDVLLARLGGVVEVKPVPDAGKGLFATKAIGKGQVSCVV